MSALKVDFENLPEEKLVPADLHLPPAEVPFDPKSWAVADIVDSTGSYAYALNIPQLGEVKPGLVYYRPVMDDAIQTLKKLVVNTPDQLHSLLADDGLQYLGNDISDNPRKSCLPENGHVIAFFSREPNAHRDSLQCAHETLCVRRDSNGKWSYRVRAGCPSPSIPQQKDWQKNDIISLRDANFGPYKRFLGCATIPYEGIFYYPRLTLSSADLAPFTALKPVFKAEERHFGC